MLDLAMGFKGSLRRSFGRRKTYNFTHTPLAETLVKLHAERIEGTNAIARHSVDGVIVNGVEHRNSVVVPWAGEVHGWPAERFEALTAAHFEALARLRPELVVFGSGRRLRFAKPALLRPLIDAGIGIETMDTPAACRTYNVLLAEGRSVVAALLFEPAG
ncbi:MAG TPA: Mth938-like domain-containing protein [Albitalea sp.]